MRGNPLPVIKINKSSGPIKIQADETRFLTSLKAEGKGGKASPRLHREQMAAFLPAVVA